MGNDQSHVPSINIEEEAIALTDFWYQHSGKVFTSDNVTNITVFMSQQSGSTSTNKAPLRINIKNLKIYRHPCILKYISSWEDEDNVYLAVEEVVPLSHVISNLNILQISVGLYSILKALIFLHNNASASHNNLCMASTYVTNDGSWKLGSMEFLCHYKELSPDFLSKTKKDRYSKSKAIDPTEEKIFQLNLDRRDYIDVYGFGILAYEILKNKSSGDIEFTNSFLDYCEKKLQSNDITQRPTFKEILEHNFFQQEYIKIHSFLQELPLKTGTEKAHFFQTLPEKLNTFDETLIASHMGGMLLSRLVLTNNSAQSFVLPLILTTRNENFPSALFSENTFRNFLCNRVLGIFKVRDVQIRLVLLEHFSNFLHTFTKEELRTSILPELLVGIKDTNDTLVSVTLRTLADLVPILGASIVIGGNRAKLFSDGLPTADSHREYSVNMSNNVVLTPINEKAEIAQKSCHKENIEDNGVIHLPERSRPDGYSIEEDLDNWEDWEVNDSTHNNPSSNTDISCKKDDCITTTIVRQHEDSDINVKPTMRKIHKSITDISQLDIKNQPNKNDDIDFFEDMEPVIDKSNKFIIAEVGTDHVDSDVKSKLALKADEDIEEGWGDGEWD